MAEFLKDSDAQTLESTTVSINRTAKTVKGGRNMSFSALVVVGDRRGSVGVGYGKGRGVPVAIEKAQKDARKNLVRIDLKEGTLPHPVTGRFCASKVRLLPASPGTGVIAGGTVRAVLEMAGVHDCLTKSLGSTNKINLCRAVFTGLTSLQPKEKFAELRGVEIEKTHVEEILEFGSKFVATTRQANEGGGATATVTEPGTADKSETEPTPATQGSPEPEPEATEAAREAPDHTETATKQAIAADAPATPPADADVHAATQGDQATPAVTEPPAAEGAQTPGGAEGGTPVVEGNLETGEGESQESQDNPDHQSGEDKTS
ncbi:MAG: 30S ribosomal protein S5 [Phycisphaeraceae bacterium]